ncbi:hypothetical protein ASPCAL07538 [Aspergillus calidoustus]|uniref:F-box domain-containing protein n=1 Tax=Aspergillus calidoustus TaxID=454130 RepID=A0A0U5GSV3_ASPCI|nr:hypothetical protein ASPCAL07538 [Aspergillus calidoustus]
MQAVADPLARLPPELVLRVVEFASLSTLASLTAVSKAWHQFIDVTHQETIYSSKVGECSRDLVLQISDDPVWRFRADLKRRFIVSTSHAGGLNVTDLDTGEILWRLPSTLDSDAEEAVRPYAHLEYQDGMAVFDREGDAVEVWQADLDDAPRGEFRRIAVLDHDCQTRGFQLSYSTLCVVSTQGQGFVYDMTQRPPRRTTHLTIENDAVGHLDQSHDAVMYSMGPRGYHVYSKSTGELMGVLKPSECAERYHISPSPGTFSGETRPMTASRHGSTAPVSLGPAGSDRLMPIQIAKGRLPLPSDPDHIRNGEDEWGAGMEDNGLFVGVSRAGRVFVCSNWRKALRDSNSFQAQSAIIECESDGSTFDLGGWLSVRNNRLMFEVEDRAYIVALDENGRIQDPNRPLRPSYSLYTSSTPQLAVPVSFMALFEDSIMTTYTTLGRRLHNRDPAARALQDGLNRIFPTKTIRLISLAPDPPPGAGTNPEDSRNTGLWNFDQHPLTADAALRSQALLQLLDIFQGDFAEGGDDETDHEVDDEWEDLDDPEGVE